LLLVCLLSLATALVLAGLAQTITTPAPYQSGSAAGAENVALAHAFYEAANAVLTSGDATPLAALVAPELAEHPPRPGATGRAGLAQALLARHAVFPGLRLVVDDLRAAGPDQVAVRVHAEGAATGTFLGRPVPVSLAAWGPVEVLRVAAGRIVERWGGTDEAIRLSPLWEVPYPPVATDATQVVAIRQVSWAPGAALTVVENPAAWFLLVETGSLEITALNTDGPVTAHVEVTGAAGEATVLAPDQPVGLATGALVVVSPFAGFSVRNAGAERATALLVASWTRLSPQSPAGYPGQGSANMERRAAALGLAPGTTASVEPAPGVTTWAVTTIESAGVPPRGRLAVGRVTLAPAASLVLPGGTGPTVLAVEAGSLHLEATRGVVWPRGAKGQSDFVPPSGILVSGDGAVLPTGTAGSWRAGDDTPVTVLAVAFIPDPAP
jgi:hypothetical protein